MNDEESNENTSPESLPPKIWKGIRRGVNKAGNTAVSTTQKGKVLGIQLAQTTGQTTQTAMGRMQRHLGEDYYDILTQNPIVLDTLSRTELLQENKILLETTFNIPWSSSILWGFTVGITQMNQKEIANIMGQLFHYGPGHISSWDDVNKFMDQVSGKGHRLKHGHSIEYLPEIIERFGVKGVPAYTMHLLQDFTTTDGIPFVPKAWQVKQGIQSLGIHPHTAARLVSLSFTGLMSTIFVFMWASSIYELTSSVLKKRQLSMLLQIAEEALQHGDYKTAASNYEMALDIDANPYIMIALGQVFAQHKDTRFKAHQHFDQAVHLLANQPGKTMTYHGVKLSVRGMVGVQALATVDVYEGMPQDYWNEYLSKLVKATCNSFRITGRDLAKHAQNRISGTVKNPAQFSAAINYYLAAKAACYYPFLRERDDLIITNLDAAKQALDQVEQYDETVLGPSVENLRQLWTYELLPSER